MRLPYASSTPPSDNPEVAAIYQRIETRRAPRPLISLDLTLLHSPHIADGWNSLLGAIRTKSSLPPAILEIAICRVAYLNGASYEWEHHAPLAIAGGVSEEGVKSLAKEVVNASGEELDGKQWAVVRYTDAMTKHVSVPDDVFEELRKHFGEREVVEITATVAAYNCVSRFLVALDVNERNGVPITGDVVAHH